MDHFIIDRYLEAGRACRRGNFASTIQRRDDESIDPGNVSCDSMELL